MINFLQRLKRQRTEISDQTNKDEKLKLMQDQLDQIATKFSDQEEDFKYQ